MIKSGKPASTSFRRGKPKLLLHACCAPCGGFLTRELAKDFLLAVYYDNSNVYPREEFEKRLAEAKKFFSREGIDFIEARYNHDHWLSLVAGLENEPERGKRCILCYYHRLRSAAQYAKKNHFEYFGSTLAISPHKDAWVINNLGKALAEQIGVHPHTNAGKLTMDSKKESANDADAFENNANIGVGVKFLAGDWKKQDGFKKAMALSHEHHFYQQNYCGCEFSGRK